MKLALNENINDLKAIMDSQLCAIGGRLDDVESRRAALEVDLEPQLQDKKSRLDSTEERFTGLNVDKIAHNSMYTSEDIGEMNERIRRARHVIVYKYNVPEEKSLTLDVRVRHDKNAIGKLLTLINFKSDSKLIRVGNPNKEKPRLLKVIFPSEQDTRMFFKNGPLMLSRKQTVSPK